MPRPLTSDELILLRSDVQWSKLYLAILKPNTIYTALLNGVPSSNDRVSQITFDGASGTLSDVKPGMTLYVGSSAGAFDLGMCRIRKAPIAGTFYVGLTSEITWADNCYLTVVDDFDLWAKHATINSSALAMDVDVTYSNQHTAFSPVPVLGSHAVAWLDEASVDVDFDAGDSWVIGSTISGYAWFAPGSSASSGMTSATPTITYDTPGCYRVLCTVTAANGKTTTGVRHVFVYDRTDNQPSTVFQLSQCVGDYDTGGWMFDMSMQAEASLSEIRDRSLVVLFAEDWYGSTQQSIGPIENRENIVCVGRVVGESIRWDRESGLVHFTVQGFQYWLNKIKTFPVDLLFAANTPTSWSQMPAMTVDRILYHVLYWHSTAIETMDFYPTQNTCYAPDGKTMASTIWGQLSDIALSRVMASPGVDRFGRLHVQIDSQMVPEVDRDWANVMDITDVDFNEAIELQRVTVQDCSLVTLSTQQADISGKVQVLYSLSPGHVPLRYGEPEQADRLLAATQAKSNQLAGLLLGWRTNEYPDIPLVFAMNNRMLDLYPRQMCGLTIAEGNTPRGIAFDGNIIPRRMTIFFDADSGYMHSELNFEAETFEQINTNGDVPEGSDLSIPPIPNIKIPNLPPLEPIFWGDVSSAPNGPSTVILLDDDKGILFTKNFSADVSEILWQFANAGIDADDIPNIADVCLTPSGSVWVWAYPSTSSFSPTSGGGIYYASALGGMFTKVVDYDWFISNSYTMTDKFIAGFAINPQVPEEVAFVAGCNDFGPFTADVNFWIGNRTGFTRKAICTNVNRFAGMMRYAAGKWILLAEQFTFIGFWDSRLWRFTADGSAVEYQTGISSGTGALTQRLLMAGTSPLWYYFRVFGNGFFISNDNGDTITLTGDNKESGGDFGYACTPNGQTIMGVWDTGQKGISTDYGTTWTGLPSLPPGGSYCFAYAGGSGSNIRWIAARGVVRYSNDLGTSWYNKEGNLGYLIPVGMSIIKAIVPGISWS
jgi:hypothetical protein